MITSIAKIGLDVADQEAAKAFWCEQVGFECLEDLSYDHGTHRWIEVAPSNRSVRFVLNRRADGQPHPAGTMAHVLFTCDDIERTHRQMLARGVRFTRAPSGEFEGWSAIFADHEGRLFVLGQH